MSNKNFFYNIEKSAILTFIGVICLFSGAVIVTLIAPSLVDPTWTEPTSDYQVQMYEVADPNFYISASQKLGGDLQHVYHIKKGFSLLAFQESSVVRFIAEPDLEPFITRYGDKILKLTSEILLLKAPSEEKKQVVEEYQIALQDEWEKEHPEWEKENLVKPHYVILELYRHKGDEAFARAPEDSFLENWVDTDYEILDSEKKQPWHENKGVIYVSNPEEYKISYFKFTNAEGWKYDPESGRAIANLQELKSHPLGFVSRQELIDYGEHLFAVEGCWYCHTDQTRTLIQDVVSNGSAAFPAPPSSANEYIYQKITFAGTRRIGPDISREGIKKPSRDWHKSHFWSPKTASIGSVMPAFQHFFDFDPRGTSKLQPGIPNYKFEAMFQYLMTKGTRITPPTQAWWLGLDPINTKAIIEGKKVLP